MKLNERLLRRIQKHILEEPRRFFMAWYYRKFVPSSRTYASGISDLPKIAPACGTVACICGWANILTGAESEIEISDPERAADRLGLRPHGAGDFAYLFNVREWPEPFRHDYSSARLPKQRVKIAVARIEHLIETGE